MPAWMSDELADLRRHGLYRSRHRVQSAPGIRLQIGGREFLSFAANDYLNLAADRRLAEAAARAARRFGTGAGASPLVCGYLPPHRTLERALAGWEQTESAVVFSSGFAANLAVLSALANQDDVLCSDQLNHASLIDGCRLSRAEVRVYRHCDANHLDELLARGGDRRRFIVSDTVFSMDGDVAPLADLADVARRRDCILIVDEAHATGVLGDHGRGLTESLPPERTLSGGLIKVGTLSKALGAQGGFVCGERVLSRFLVNRARSYIFSTALAPPAAAAARRAIGIARAEPQRRRGLLDLANRLRQRLREQGFDTANSCCQIVPVIVGKASAATALSQSLQERGLLVPAIRPPSVPAETSRLRISLTAGHTVEDVERLVTALSDCRCALGGALR